MVIHVENTGRTAIDASDINLPLSFVFAGRRVMTVDIADSKPRRHAPCHHRVRRTRIDSDTITLPRFPMNPADQFDLAATLSGTENGVTCVAHIRRTPVVRHTT